jgi:hypothetical protein
MKQLRLIVYAAILTLISSAVAGLHISSQITTIFTILSCVFFCLTGFEVYSLMKESMSSAPDTLEQ